MDRVFLAEAVTALVFPFYALAVILAAFGFQRLSNRLSQMMAGVGLGIAIMGLAFWLGWTSELSKFGAHAFQSDPHRVITFGGKPLVAAEVDSPYIIRVAIALLMLASSIEGRSTIYNATPIRRAHPRFVENLRSLGAELEWK